MENYFVALEEVNAILSEDRVITAVNNLMSFFVDPNVFDELGETNQLTPPASQSEIDNLLEEKIEENGGQCRICLTEYEKGEVVKVLPCKHKYHSVCIKVWLAKTNTCPLCRYELPTDDKNYEESRKERRRRDAATNTEDRHN